MSVLNKFLLPAISSAVALLVSVILNIDPAQAALLKFIFEGEGVNGYFTYDDSAIGRSPYTPNATAYPDGGYDYKFDFGEKGVFEGSVGNPIIFLARAEDGIPYPDTDDFIWEVRAFQRQPASEFAFVSYFHYPEDTFGGSTAIRTTVPSTAILDVYPNVDPSASRGDLLYTGTVRTRIEKVPEPTFLPALLGVGTWFLFRRQCRPLLSAKD
ncbi:MAG: PEP-CTERM sorting domain-containing protein [Nostoc sp. DedQUE12b]|uniref:PEP-CTERM sorting domain-containing protein n=1 Tax=Nostoc sp. DedQUE12b TaxID=3075398 RepID=UPI002AD3E958|nr:PEP-CTERM sorting domain-containing protein [Nostoc sp. DedQUE12b]MDZ8089899.1 PEP-CTERM sorting domain-containing protein [Nostoc sp. DedQUE12b]